MGTGNEDKSSVEESPQCSEEASNNNVGRKTCEEVADEAMGKMGRWQLKIVLLMAATKFPVAWTLLGIMFMGAPVKYHCTNASSNSTCLTQAGDECHHWTYDRSVFKETIVTEWDLVCSKRQLVNVAQMTFMIGIMFGNILFSIASDRWGRKIPLVVTGILQVATGVCVAFVPWYIGFVILRFLQALAVGGTMTISFVLCMEVLSGKWRTIMATLTHIPFNIGTILMSVIAYYANHWRTFQLAISLPVIVVITYWWLVPESPRWLMAVGRNKEALKILQSAAKINKKVVPEKIPELHDNEKVDERKAGVIDLFRTPNMRKKTLVIWINWIVVGFCFFGLEQYLSQTGGNIFINVIISGACIIPGVLFSIYTMDRFGRKLTLFGGQTLSAICCFIIICVPDGAEHFGWLRVGLAIIGASGTAVAFTTLYLYSSELFPTVVRNTGLGSGSMCARIGSMVAPFIASLDIISTALPPALFGVTSVIAACLCLLLPETLNTDLPVTLRDGENFVGKSNKRKELSGKTNKAYNEDKETAAG